MNRLLLSLLVIPLLSLTAIPAAQPSRAAARGVSDTIAVSAVDLLFEPSEITARPGDTIVLTNDGALPHNLVITELGEGTATIMGGETAEYTLPADLEPGTYEIECSVPGHAQAGMVGTLTVVAASETPRSTTTNGVTPPPTESPIVLPSGPGGIGNTRSDAYDFWRIEGQRPTFGGSAGDGALYQDQLFEVGDYNLTLTFLLAGDDKVRDTDRLVQLTVEWVTTFSQGRAEQMRASLIPRDSKRFGGIYINRFGDPCQRYDSSVLAEQVPSITVFEGFGPPGRVWTIIAEISEGNGVLEVSLTNPWPQDDQ